MQEVPAQVAPPYPRFTRGVSEVSQPLLATQEGPEGEGMTPEEVSELRRRAMVAFSRPSGSRFRDLWWTGYEAPDAQTILALLDEIAGLRKNMGLMGIEIDRMYRERRDSEP